MNLYFLSDIKNNFSHLTRIYAHYVHRKSVTKRENVTKRKIVYIPTILAVFLSCNWLNAVWKPFLFFLFIKVVLIRFVHKYDMIFSKYLCVYKLFFYFVPYPLNDKLVFHVQENTIKLIFFNVEISCINSVKRTNSKFCWKLIDYIEI